MSASGTAQPLVRREVPPGGGRSYKPWEVQIGTERVALIILPPVPMMAMSSGHPSLERGPVLSH